MHVEISPDMLLKKIYMSLKSELTLENKQLATQQLFSGIISQQTYKNLNVSYFSKKLKLYFCQNTTLKLGPKIYFQHFFNYSIFLSSAILNSFRSNCNWRLTCKLPSYLASRLNICTSLSKCVSDIYKLLLVTRAN